MLSKETVTACLPHLCEGDIDKAVTEYHTLPRFEENVAGFSGLCVFELGSVNGE